MSDHTRYHSSTLEGLNFVSRANLPAFAFFSIVLLIAWCGSSRALWAQTPTPVPVLTWRYDLTHAGQNTQETALTPQNVNPSSFGKLFSVSVDSTVYAQPLYVPALQMSDGLVHNVLFVATENDSIYAFDADSSAKPIWQISLLTAAHGAGAGATAVPWQDAGSPDVAPTVGITGTPTINPATNTMYVVAATKESGNYFSRLHAINIITGQEQPGSPVNITATVTGTGNGSSGGKLTFSPLWENQRPALNYYNGYVYFGYAAHGDLGPWHGWLFAYNATTLKQSAVMCLTPNGVGAGLWASGAGMPIDTSTNRMFIATGNGNWSAPPFTSASEYGESVVAINLSNGGLTPVDEFTSFNYAALTSKDWDLGAGGLLMLDQQGAFPHELIIAGKEGRITTLDRDNLGGLASGASSNTNAIQDNDTALPAGMGLWSTPAYWNGNVYIWAAKNHPMLFQINSGIMDSTPSNEASITSTGRGATFSVSSNGTQDGIAWVVDYDQYQTNGPAILYAWNANDLSQPLYASNTNSARDTAGPANKFSIPMVTNGKVYIPFNGGVDVYGLINGEQTAAAPTISPNGGNFASAQTVTMSSATSSATINYTLDGSTPTSSSTEYTGPITVSTNTTVKAIAHATGFLQSPVTTAVFTFGSASNAVVITSPINGATIAGPVNVVAQAFESVTVSQMQVWDNGTKLGAFPGTVVNQVFNLAAGKHTTTVLDLNSSYAVLHESSVTYTVGTAPPVGGVQISSPVAGEAFPTTSVQVIAQASESVPVSQMQVWDNGTKLGAFTGTVVNQVFTLAPGQHTMTVLDLNSSYAVLHESSVTYTVQGSTPTNGVKVTSPTPGEVFPTTTVLVVAQATESVPISQMQVWDNGKKLAFYPGSSVNHNYTLAVGSHTVTVLDLNDQYAVLHETSVSYTVK
jgi:Chitobiase/beta-hexosaminidase C-terminal domain